MNFPTQVLKNKYDSDSHTVFSLFETERQNRKCRKILVILRLYPDTHSTQFHCQEIERAGQRSHVSFV